MRRKNYGLAFLGFLCGLTACGDAEQKESGTEFYEVEMNEGSSDPEYLSEVFAEFSGRLVPLEAEENNLLSSASRLTVFKDQLFVEDIVLRKIFQYDGDGTLVKEFNKHGSGADEYLRLSSTRYTDEGLFTYDWMKKEILHYDYDGNLLKSITVPRTHGGHFSFDPQGNIVQYRRYPCDHKLMTYNKGGEVLSEYCPTPSELTALKYVHYPSSTIGQHGNGVYFTLELDNRIYHLKDTLSVLADFDFKSKNLPDDFFEGGLKRIQSRFNKLRLEEETVLGLGYLAMNDEWFIFCPSIVTSHTVVFCSRKDKKTIINKDFSEPYKTLLKEYDAVHGYDATKGEFYTLLDAVDLKTLLEELQETDPTYAEKYPFLANIDPDEINEEDNHWAFFYKF